MKSVTYTDLQRKLYGGMIPAVPVPMNRDKEIHQQAHQSYVHYLSQQDIRGVAIWVHTGRGLYLSSEQRKYVFESWKRQLRKDKVIVAGVGSRFDPSLPFEKRMEKWKSDSLTMAREAAQYGADALLVFAPIIFQNQKDQGELIFAYHQKICELGVPVILFYLYEEAGGIHYSMDLLRRLLALEHVIGIKVATLDSVMTFQDVSKMMQEEFPEKLLITGEDRMYGYTLMRGAQSSLVGLGAACVSLQTNMLNSYFSGDMNTFVKFSQQVDELAEVIFVKPMEQYITRMLLVLAMQGIIPLEAVHEVMDYPLTNKQSEEIRFVLEKIGQL